MSMFQQPGGFSPFIPRIYPQSLPQTNIIRPVVPTNLIGEMDKVGSSRSRKSRSRRSHTKITSDGDVRSVHSKDEDWDLPQALKKLKGKAIQPEGSRRSAFQRLGHDGRNQNRPAKERLGVETTPVSAFDRLGKGAGRPGRTRCTEPPPRDEPQISRAPQGEEEAESHPRHTVRTHVEQPRNRVGRVEARLEKLHQRSGRMMGFSGDEKCLLFFQTLRGRAAEWFHNLPPGEIVSFDELAEVFQEKFKENCTKRKKFTYLSTAGQREHEDLTKFLTRWKDEVDKVEEMDDKTVMSLLSGLRSGKLYKEFCRRPPQSYQEAYNTAWDYADVEAQVSSKREAEQGHSKGRISLKKEIEQPGGVKAEVLQVKPAKAEKKPTGEKQWTEKYCSFHKIDSHNTVECNGVKGLIKQMIEAGELDPEYLAQVKQKKNQWNRPEAQPANQSRKKKAGATANLRASIWNIYAKMHRWRSKLRCIAALHSTHQSSYFQPRRLLHSSSNLFQKSLFHSALSSNFKHVFSYGSISHPLISLPVQSSLYPASFMQVRHITAKQKKRKLKSRKPMTPVVSKVKKIKIKGYSSFKGRFRVMNDGQIRRWKEGKRHNAHLKSKSAKRRLRKPGTVPVAYAKVLKKLNFRG
ncbi:unnamed protein product [Cuscuta campestris]|uniref:Retrotransposon gag domain-containing protein n=1 Tax=Cuscuta campestris TaxID=132261 RepID=A0A484LA72_9ASTE|nr:unnamed protein product [Cuscuta campestris]